MASGEGKEPGRGGSRDVDDLKARLGLKTPRKAPAVAPPPPSPPPTPSPIESIEPTIVSGQPEITQPLPREVVLARAEAQRAETTARIPAVEAPARPSYAVPPPWIEEAPPPPKTTWQRWGRSATIALVIALMGAALGYVFGKGSSRSDLLARVKTDAGRIAETLQGAFARVEEVAMHLDPMFAAAKKQGKDLPPVRGVLRANVDWAGLEAMSKFEVPKEIESIFDTGFFKMLGGARGKMFAAFLVDFQRLAQSVRDHVQRTNAGRAQLEAELKSGAAAPRAYAVVSQPLPSLERGEVVMLRGRRTVKSGKEEVVVFDVARPSAPSQPIAVPEEKVVILNAPGLIKAGSALLEEYNRRMRELALVAQRLLEGRVSVLALVEKVSGKKS
jgi:hypothetical protein